MAESMKGLKRSHRCTEVSNDRGNCHPDGMGTEKKKSGKSDFC